MPVRHRIGNLWTAVSCVLVAVLLPAAAGFAAAPARAAVPEYAWAWPSAYSAGTAGSTAFVSLVRGPAGSVYAAGTRDGGDPGTPAGAGLLAVRVDAVTGARIWSRSTHGPGGRGALATAATADRRRSLFVVGAAAASGPDVGLVVKYASSGRLLWSRRFAGSRRGPSGATAVAADARGNVYVAGFVTGARTGRDAVLLKYDAGGRLRWKHVLATAKADGFASLALDAGGDPYAVGTRFADDAYSQVVTVRVRANGRLMWRRYVDLAGTRSVGVKVVVRVSGATAGVYVAGTRTGTATGDRVVPRLGKYSLAGAPLWGAPLPVTVSALTDMAVDREGRIVFVGGGYDATDGQACGLMGFVDVDGTLSSTYLFSREESGVADGVSAGLSRVVVDSSGRSYASGWVAVAAGGAGTSAIAVSRPAGAEVAGFDRLWRYDGPASGDHDRFTPLLVVTAGEVYAAGSSDGHDAVVKGVVERLGPAASR